MIKKKAEPLDIESIDEVSYLKKKFQSYREKIYDDIFFIEISKSFNISHSNKESFETSILAAAEAYQRLIEINKNIEPVHKSKNRILSLQKKITAAKYEYIKFTDSPEATVDELFCNLDCMYDEGKYKRFFDCLHDSQFHGGGVEYNLKNIIEFFDALIEATEQSNEYFTNGNPIKKHDAIVAWLSRMECIFKNYTNIPFTQGKYYVEVGNISVCLDILYQIIAPLDPRITKQYLAHKLKEYNLNKNR